MKYQHTAKGLAALGRHGDDVLMHVNKDELAGLQALLGPVTVNPETGLPEAFNWKSLLATAGMGLLGVVGGAPIAEALGLGSNALASGAIGAGLGGVGGGAISAAQGHGFGPGALGGAIAGGMGGFGGADLVKGTETAGTGATSAMETAGKYAGSSLQQENLGNLTNIKNTVITDLPNTPIGATSTFSKATGDVNVLGSLVKKPQALPFNPISEGQAAQQGNLYLTKAAQDATTAGTTPTPGFQDFLGKQVNTAMTKKGMSDLFTPVALGIGIGTMAQDSMIQSQQYQQQRQQAEAQANANAQDQQNYFASLGFPLAPLSPSTSPDTATQRNYYLNLLYPQSGYAAGGAITASRLVDGIPVHTTLPPKYVDEFERSDIGREIPEAYKGVGQLAGDVGLAAQKAITRRMANGGYLDNTVPTPPGGMYPQSLIPQAQPHPGATPVRQEVLNGYADGGSVYEKGGFLDGPGDGMSDDIPANIDGQEEVRLADGEFVIPPEIVSMLGYGDPEKGAAMLDKLLPMVRQAAHGKSEQVKQDAGKKVVEKALGGLPQSGKQSLAAQKAEKRKARG